MPANSRLWIPDVACEDTNPNEKVQRVTQSFSSLDNCISCFRELCWHLINPTLRLLIKYLGWRSRTINTWSTHDNSQHKYNLWFSTMLEELGKKYFIWKWGFQQNFIFLVWLVIFAICVTIATIMIKILIEFPGFLKFKCIYREENSKDDLAEVGSTRLWLIVFCWFLHKICITSADIYELNFWRQKHIFILSNSAALCYPVPNKSE